MTNPSPASAVGPPAPRAPSVADPLRTRASISNGSRSFLLPVGDRLEARRIRDLMNDYAVDVAAVSELDWAQCRATAILAYQNEENTLRKARGESIEPGEPSRTANRLLDAITDLRALKRANLKATR